MSISLLPALSLTQNPCSLNLTNISSAWGSVDPSLLKIFYRLNLTLCVSAMLKISPIPENFRYSGLLSSVFGLSPLCFQCTSHYLSHSRWQVPREDGWTHCWRPESDYPWHYSLYYPVKCPDLHWLSAITHPPSHLPYLVFAISLFSSLDSMLKHFLKSKGIKTFKNQLCFLFIK